MISIKKCREILGEKGKHLSDQQLEAVRSVLSKLAQINVHIINENKNSRDEESSNNV
jgi:uncharacterized membrane protein